LPVAPNIKKNRPAIKTSSAPLRKAGLRLIQHMVENQTRMLMIRVCQPTKKSTVTATRSQKNV